MSTRAPQRSTSARKQDEGPSILKGFSLDTPSGRGELVSLVLVFITPILAFYISVWLLFLLVPALAVSLVTLPRVAARGSQQQVHRAAQAGLAMTVNGALLFLSMIVIGFIEDFIGHSEEGFRGHDVVSILTVVHIMLGVGLQLWDSFRD